MWRGVGLRGSPADAALSLAQPLTDPQLNHGLLRAASGIDPVPAADSPVFTLRVTGAGHGLWSGLARPGGV